MKASIMTYILPAVFTICVSTFSCNKDKNETNDFLIKVDSIKIPEIITSAVPFDVEFFGTIGFNGCFSFKTFNTVDNGSSITIEAWGTSDFSNLLCPDALVSLNGYKLTLTIPYPGIYKMIIHEPGNYSLTKQINVN
jgi:hypothetical protein